MKAVGYVLAGLCSLYAVGWIGKGLSAESDLAVLASIAGTIAMVYIWWVATRSDRQRLGQRLGKWIDSLAVVALAVFVAGCSCSVIEPGHVGIVVDNFGSDRGVQNYTLQTGFVIRPPFVYSIFEYPINTQTVRWEDGEALSFNSKEGTIFTAPMSLSYSLEASKVPAFYVKFRSDNINHYTHGYLRNVARDALNEESAQYTAEEVYADKKEVILAKARARINKQVNEYGVIIEQFGFLSAPNPPDVIKAAINAKTGAIQKAIQVENEVRQSRAEAEKSVAQAEGQARSNIALAKGVAEATLTKARAQAEANRVVAASLTPTLVQYEAVLHWNGARPQVEGSGSGLLIQVK